ncbi:putative G2/M phase-specific E3 ubiquitin-protein ligase-like [Scophthalmus maximus]|uniref:Putative G2/M phase-specific E3 ubiquitin-protein ligase-like n=1 Tax=Scophthalmus maximus TaxID=52904 RepID=A0A2U9C1S5_SCOMX|nr:putative G2/M phase-specific E3 ubiquitin-protein ligase-like [Scophthalmus maximus]
MKVGEKKKAALLLVTESIEMELFSSEELCAAMPTQAAAATAAAEERRFHQRHQDHPLVPDCEEEPEPEPEPQVPTQPGQRAKPKPEPPAGEETRHCAAAPHFTEEMEMEMEVFPLLTVSESEQASANKTSRLKWKRLVPQRTGLVVKDVICLPGRQYLARLERHVLPQGKERAALVAMGMTARITIDSSWSANQMESRLAMLFRGKFVKRPGQRFSFIYLQGSRVLFVPDAPAGGWTGEQVVRISGHGPLYVFTHHDLPQFTLDLDTVLRLFRQEKMDRDVETHVQVRRRDLLRGALKVVRRPGFSFSTTPVISFSGEEADGHEGPLREFFRLTLLELQQSSIFEGRPGRAFLTYDLTALEDGKYYEAGVLIGWSLAQGGPGPRCLHPALFQLMCGHNPSLEDFSWTDIADADVQIRLQQLHSCTDVKLLSPSLCDWVSSCGFPGIYSAHSGDLPAIYNRLVKHHIYHRVASMISRFTEGMNSCGGLWDTVLSHWQAFVPVMTSAQQEPLTLEQFRQLFDVCYSRRDCRLRAAEEATVGHWETVLAFVGNGQADFSFEDVLAFITGADHLPPLGFARLISLCFYSQDGLPHASTCALELFLPRAVAGAADLLALLSRAVHEALGFARLQGEGDGETDICTEPDDKLWNWKPS